MDQKKTSSFRALRDLPPPDPERLKAFRDEFPARLAQYERRFAEQGEIEQISDRWMDRSYDL